MIERTGPADKPRGDPPGYAKAHPIKHAIGTLAAIFWGVVILLAALSVLAGMLLAFF